MGGKGRGAAESVNVWRGGGVGSVDALVWSGRMERKVEAKRRAAKAPRGGAETQREGVGGPGTWSGQSAEAGGGAGGAVGGGAMVKK